MHAPARQPSVHRVRTWALTVVRLGMSRQKVGPDLAAATACSLGGVLRREWIRSSQPRRGLLDACPAGLPRRHVLKTRPRTGPALGFACNRCPMRTQRKHFTVPLGRRSIFPAIQVFEYLYSTNSYGLRGPECIGASRSFVSYLRLGR
mgnify:CR=1 FL=1